MIFNSLRPGPAIVTDPLGIHLGGLSFNAYRTMLGTVPLGRGFLNTLIVVAVKGAITMLFCPLAGYGFAKYQFVGKRVLFGVLMATLMLPTLVLIVPLLLEMSALGWVNSFQALILPGCIDAFSIFWMRQVIEVVPDELLDAGRIDGCSEFGLFFRIVVPVIRPGLAALGVLTFIGIYNDFVWPVIVTNDEQHQTLQVLLSTLSQNISAGQLGTSFGNVWGETLAASTLASLPVLIVFVVMQRQFVNGLLAGSSKT
jgi:ABC-type glycerol-3-phosphate transport system permease component